MELLARSRFDLVVSDLKMPRMGGLALARQILSSLPITPIFFITADVSDDLESILSLGLPWLNKPLSLDQLLSQIQKVLGNGGKLNSQLVEQ